MQTQRYNDYPTILKIILNICLSSFNFGFSISYFNSINFKDIVTIYNIQTTQSSAIQGLITGIISFTAGLGAYFSSYLLSNFTRRKGFQIISIYFSCVSLLLIIPNIYVLFFARCLQGFAIGIISSIAPLYIRQFSPVELAGTLCPWNQIGIVMGLTFSFVLSFLLQSFFPVQVYWRIVFVFPIITSLIQLYNLKFNYPYETPKYLVLQNKDNEAKELLALIYKQEFVDEVFWEIKKAISDINKTTAEVTVPNIIEIKKSSSDLSAPLNETEMYEIKDFSKQSKQELNNEIIMKAVIKTNLQTNPLAKIAAINLSLGQQLVGMGCIIAYSGQIVGSLIPFIQKLFPIIINLLALLGAFLCIPFMRMMGRKAILQSGCFSLAFFLVLISICFYNYDFDNKEQNGTIIKFIICVIFLTLRLIFSFSMGPVVWIYISETVQQNFISVSTMINWMTVTAVNTLFPIVNKMIGGNPSFIFLFFGICTLVGGIINKMILVETQGKKQFEINQQFSEKLKHFTKE